MIRSPAFMHRPKGTTLLYIAGIIAVMAILAFGVSTQSLAHKQVIANHLYRARTAWLLRSAPIVAVESLPSLGKSEKSLVSSVGKLTCVRETTASAQFRATAWAPAVNPRIELSHYFTLPNAGIPEH